MTYLLLDKALIDLDKNNIKGKSLFSGKTGEMLDSVAPYLCNFEMSSIEFNTFLTRNENINWGIMIDTAMTFDQLHSHLRKFLYVKTEDGKKLYFRFYDPSVLPTFLRTCDVGQLQDFFGLVDHFLCKGEELKIFAFSFDKVKLVEESQDLEAFLKLNFPQ